MTQKTNPFSYLKITTEKLVVLIIYLGFISVSSSISLQEIQSDAVANKGIRIASIAIAFLISFGVFSSRNILRYLMTKTLLPLFLFFCSAILTIFWSAVPGLTLFKSFELLLVILLGLIGISSKGTKAYDLFRWILIIFIVQIAVVWIEALLFPKLAFVEVRGATPLLGTMLRGVYPVVNPNTVGFLGGVIAVAYIPQVVTCKKLIWTDVAVLIMGLAAVIASYSRGALITSGIVVGLYLIVSRKYKIILFLTIVSFVVFISGKYNIFVDHLQRGKEYVDVATFSSGRTSIWSLVLDNYNDYLLGQGYAVGFRIAKVLGNTNAHNSIIEILAGGGIVAVFTWVLIYCNLFSRLYFYYKTRLKQIHVPHFFSVINTTLYLLLSSFTNVRGVYLDYGMLLLISIIVYTEKINLNIKNVQCKKIQNSKEKQ